MQPKIYLLFISIVLSSWHIYAQEGWTLEQCVQHATTHNLSVQRAEVSVKQGEVDVNTRKWARLPNLNGSASHNMSWGRTASPVDNSYTNVNTQNSSFGLSTSVPLFTGLELPNQYALAKLNLKASIEDLNKAKDDLSINVASGYVQVLFNKELWEIAKEQVKLSTEQLARISRMQEVGKASVAEVAEANARVAQDEMSAVQAENNYRLALLDLSQLLELPTPEGFSVAVPEVTPDLHALTPPDAIFLQASDAKPEVLAAQYRLEGSEKSIKIAQSGHYPSLSFNAGLSTSFYTTDGKSGDSFFNQLDNHLNKYIGFSLSVPIFNRFATRNQVRNSKLQQKNYAIQLEETKKTLYKEIQQAWYNAVAAESQFRSSNVAVEANQESFRLMKEKFENGKSTSVEYNEAKLNLMKAESDRVQAKYEYMFRTKVVDFYKGEPIR